MSVSMKKHGAADAAAAFKPTHAAKTRRTPIRWADHVAPRLKGWLTWDGDFLLGPRYAKLLEEIDRTGTIRAACPGVGASYRTCLNRIRRMERVVGEPLLTITRGGSAHGSAHLTPAARQLVALYRAWRATLQQLSDRAFQTALRR